MNTPDTAKAQACWRCRICGYTTPKGQDTCGNPSCRADLSLHGDIITPEAQREPAREEERKDTHRCDEPYRPASDLWDEDAAQEEPEEHTQKALSRKEKKTIKKQQAEVRAQERAAAVYQGGKVRAFFVSVLILLGSLVMGFVAFALVPLAADELEHCSAPCWLRTILPVAALVILSVLFTLLVVRSKEDRQRLFTDTAFWLVPAVICCLISFAFPFDGGDDYGILLYLALLSAVEPVLLGSAFAGVKGLRRASSLLCWLGMILLAAAGAFASYLFLISYSDLLSGILFIALSLIVHFGIAFLLLRWGRKHFGAR